MEDATATFKSKDHRRLAVEQKRLKRFRFRKDGNCLRYLIVSNILINCVLLYASFGLLERQERQSSSSCWNALQLFATNVTHNHPPIVPSIQQSVQSASTSFKNDKSVKHKIREKEANTNEVADVLKDGSSGGREDQSVTKASQNIPSMVQSSQGSSQSKQSLLKAEKSEKHSFRGSKEAKAEHSTGVVVTSNVVQDEMYDEWSNSGAQEGRFLVVNARNGTGQGSGNIAQGLLAAHLFGLEFNRTVCVVWPKFFEAFNYANPEHERICKGAEFWKVDESIRLWNFGRLLPDECALADTLASREFKVVTFVGNTYPGWRTDIPTNFFYRYFRPNPSLLHALPYPLDIPPKVVVHLRFPDGKHDENRGLDEESLHALGERLAGNGTYLVTNRPDWYKRFHECCGWSYDKSWEGKPIEHGAIGVVWSADGQTIKGREAVTLKQTFAKKRRHKAFQVTQNMKMWSDWYTMLNAEQVYHSNSDFSRSAVHWNSNCTGFQLGGMGSQTGETLSVNETESKQVKKRELNLVPASYDAVSVRIPPLVDRLDPGQMLDLDRDDCKYLRFCRCRQNITGVGRI